MLSFLFFLGFLAVVAKLFFWQVLERKHLTTLAARQYSVSLDVPTERGKIFDKDNFPLVLNRPVFLLYANPQELKISPTALAEKLELFGENKKPDFGALLDKSLLWVPLVKDLDEETKKKIEDLKIEGLDFEEYQKRFYPESSLSAQLLGFVGDDGQGQEKGFFGLEGYYNNELRGKSGRRFFQQDALGRPMPVAEEIEEKSVAGSNLFLNLDRSLQFLVESRLKKGITKYGALQGSVVIANPQNGAILAMASFPSYDQSQYYLFDPELYRNPVISSSFEPGSIFKVIVMAIGLENGAVKPNDICPSCSGPKTISDYTVNTWNEKYYPNSSMTDIIVHSDNVGMVYVGEKIGASRFYEFLEKFGFGKKTNIDLQGEISPGLRGKREWREIDLATASFGQGIAVTPIQMLTAVSAIANGGTFYQPQVVKKIFEDNRSITIDPSKKGRPISGKTAKEITMMMVQAVERGEAKWARPKGYKIAGKTGTAQIPIAGHYDPEKTIASFIGFAPADDPKFVMLVSLREPKTSPWGSETAAPLWFEIAKDIFRLWGIQPSY